MKLALTLTKKLLEEHKNQIWFPKDYSDKDNVVVWSGGADSTLLLFEIALKYGTKDKPVYAYSFHDRGGYINQAVQEKKARTKLAKLFKKLKLNIEYVELTRDTDGKQIPFGQVNGLAQAMMWFSSIYPAMVANAYIHFGYIREDDFWHYKHEAFTAFNGLRDLAGTSCELSIPFEYDRKLEVLARLKKYNLLEHIWYCEGRNTEPCGNCISCIKHNHALADLEETKNEVKLSDEKSEILRELGERNHQKGYDKIARVIAGY